MDTLTITGLNVSTKIGVYDWEQRINQQLLLDICLNTDLSACEDNLQKTIDYAALCSTVTQFIESNSFKLIETVAHEVANLIQQQFKVTQLSITVNKPHAIKNAGNIGVTIHR